ncbi:MAG: sulfite exporter TauE/SafE family protein [Gallionellaceae bacterium]|nr:sulfite exporter TauE/SafE family protein [Gallionellaceae bacterium]MDD5365162.1 sulfite exporter TauE/SafE family protein [Gallionellaceae bacterium]
MPDPAGVASAWLLGLSLGLTACTVTCLPYMGAWMLARERSTAMADTIAFLAGRVAAYALMGLAAGLAGAWLSGVLASGIGHVAVGAASAAAGLWLLLGRPRRGCGASRRERASPLVLGFTLSLTPCAPLASLLAFSAQAGSALSGMAYGLAFGLGAAVTPLLVLLPALGWFGQRLRDSRAELGLWLRRGAGAVLVLLGIYRIGLGM